MAYDAKTDWLPDDPINEDDVNRWEKGIQDAHKDLAVHKNDMNNPHNTTKAQIGLGNVDNVQQASKKEFEEHRNDLQRHITPVERENWNAKETIVGAQEKADKALSDAKYYVDTNYKNNNLTLITGDNAIQDARTGGEEYPLGLTLMDIGQGNTTGYPLGYGIVKNEKYNNYRFTQYFYGTGNESGTYYDSTGVWIRHWWSGSGWTPWQKISGFAHANIGTTGVQYLKKIDHTKIAFNRVIKDSHNAFDTKNNRFIAPNDGMYLIGASIYTLNYTSYINFHLKVYLNGKAYKTLHHVRGDFQEKDNGMNLGLNGNATVPMNKGDYVEIWCYCNYGGDETLKRAVDDKNGVFNFFDIQELGGRNYPRF
ncbi:MULTISPECIES: pyocin knob domain-containing protein [Bacillus]|uniref:Uncharacterized protein YqcC n=7 Tax=Bacteria TaxID=2 RepID=YQCC_BACSU|nr:MULTISPECIES: pyocin knob domain-containing protein [Bacillales]NP_390472.2 conserved phage protein of unknown function; skin element [Bacillus subtilis subsp. subtilis str. 168]P45938.2 RecName: Full=Uncharacterized protein YqcC [Bacillus subtilis subsp. subtilis str. 168]AOL30353.1 hypothetical protein BGM20_06800 [Alkalicoccobacillus gibsonii]POO76796.1 hypothetical protein C1T30_41320 [Bacillus sp. MBGLi97]UUT26113.1 pyocin knob domain-containing protein [Bacillus velezensis]ADV93350.1